MDINPAWLAPTSFIDYDNDAVKTFADTAVGDTTEQIEVASLLFHAVRDGIRYNPWVAAFEPAAYRASNVAASDQNWCIPKSVLFVACARYKGIPARLGFADVRNHLTSEKLSETMGTDLFYWHGYAELFLNDRWAKLSTAFNIELCQKLGTKVLEFDPVNDSLMHPYDQSGNRHMEYVNQRGTFDDLPLDDILSTFNDVYQDWSKDENGNNKKASDDITVDPVFT
ncbi:MAG: transglutaminase family protein, partial [Gammaproteobacteria bacterium]|nr:transglutaminase family protein [Gammaproteobacteria bacterium]